MKNRNIWLVFAILAAACVLFAGCKNPVMEKWWDVEKPAPAVTPPPAYHTVLFSADGGLPAPGIQQIAHGGKLVKILPMAKAHHAFGGWFRDAEFNSEWVFERDPVNNDVILYAKWVTVADVSVTFEANGGSPPPEAQSLIKDAKVVEPPPMSKPGSGFGGWYINLAAGTKYDFTIGRAVEDLTLYAKWEDNPALVFTVTFNAEGGAPPPIDQQIINGGQIVEPLPMSRSGHSFGGWYSDPLFAEGSEWDFIAGTVKSDTPLYAKWEPYYYTVTFNAMGGDPAPDSQQIIADGSGKVIEPPPMGRTGFGFGGWYMEPEFEHKWNFAAPLSENETLYAKWEEDPLLIYTVTFDANGGYPPPINQQIASEGQAVEPPPMTQPDSYFSGWLDEYDNEWDFSTPVTGNFSLHAGWYEYSAADPESVYVISFIANEGLPAPVDQWIVGNRPVIEPPPMSLAGHGFGGWYSDTDFEFKWDFANYDVTNLPSMTLYAKWVPDKYTVSFDAMGGVPAPEVQYVIYNSYATRPAAMSKPGMSSGGWFADPNFSPGSEWDFDAKVTSDVTLYARWEPVPEIYTVTFEANGGNPGPAQQSVIKNSRIIEPTAMRKAVTPGSDIWYGFGGWFTDNAYATPWDFTAGVTSNFTLYAKWDAPQCLVTFEANGGDPVPRSQDLIQGTRIVEPLPMNRSGYGFGGWYVDPNFAAGSEWNFASPVGADDITLYAKWVTNFYNVLFDAKGGSPAPASQRVAHGTLLNRPSAMKKSGYGFMGWFSDPGFIYEWDFAVDTVDREGITLYAMWGEAHYIAKFDLKLPPGSYSLDATGGHGIAVPANQELALGGRISEPSPGDIFGWSFYGWFYSNEANFVPENKSHRDGLLEWDFDKAVIEDDFDANLTLTLYARWVPAEPDMVWVRKGNFTMGASGSGTSPARNVKFMTGFYMNKYLVTQETYEGHVGYQEIMENSALPGYSEMNGSPGSANPSQFKANQPTRPVDRVSWYDALVYCNSRTMQEDPSGTILAPAYSLHGQTDPALWGPRPIATPSNWDNMTMNPGANGYRLPTEAEWEYAAKGGNGSPGNYNYAGSNNAEDVAWFNTNSGSMTHQVGTKLPNGLGIFDMNGNVMEWCWDWFGSGYYSESDNTVDPTGPLWGTDRVRRGGSWNNAVANVRNVIRSSFPPTNETWVMGFRVTRGPSEIY